MTTPVCFRCHESLSTGGEKLCGCADGITLIHGDCRDASALPKADLVLTDPPYGITANSWDVLIRPAVFWRFVLSMAKETAAIVLTASQPFTSEMVVSAKELFRHEWIWIKDRGSNFANTVREPFKEHESVLVFSRGGWIYNPQKQARAASGVDRVQYGVASVTASENYRKFEDRGPVMRDADRCPSSWQKFNRDRGLHPTQKPIRLMDYLIRTYSNPREIVFDPFAGSGTTLVAAKQLGRKAIGIEIEEKYCTIAANRLRQSVLQF